MVEKTKKNKTTYIVLYRDEFKKDYIWTDYCTILGIDDNCTEIKINIKSIEKLK